ncbi:MAG: hypothetical protein V1792_15760 [Pseudomonadota bacterium]
MTDDATASFSTLIRCGRLWIAMTDGAGPLPEAKEFKQLLEGVGFTDVRCEKPVVLSSYQVFSARRP